MTASWTSHGRAVLVAVLALLLLFPAAASGAGDIDRLLERDHHKRSAFTEVRAIRAAEAKAARTAAAKEAKAAAAVQAGKAAPPVADYGESAPLELPADARPGPDRAAAGSGSMGRTLIGLLVVVGLIYGLTHLLRRMKAGALGGAGGGRADGLKAVASIPLGPNRSIHLVRAGQEYLLVGAAEHGVVPLRTYSEDEARAAGLLGAEPKGEVVTPAAPKLPGLPSRPARPAQARPALAAGSLLDELRARTVRR